MFRDRKSEKTVADQRADFWTPGLPNVVCQWLRHASIDPIPHAPRNGWPLASNGGGIFCIFVDDGKLVQLLVKIEIFGSAGDVQFESTRVDGY